MKIKNESLVGKFIFILLKLFYKKPPTPTAANIISAFIVCAVMLAFITAVIWFIWPWVNKPIHTAAEQGDLNKVQMLVEQGTPIGITNHYGQTPLFIALINHHKDIAKYLIDKGADVKADGVLRLAISQGDIKLIREIINRGAMMTSDALANYMGDNPLPNLEVLNFLLSYGVDINATFSSGNGGVTGNEIQGYTALQMASHNRDFSLVKYLVCNGADVNKHKEGDSPLKVAESNYKMFLTDPSGPGIHYYKEVGSSPEISAFLKSNGAKE